MQVLKFTSWTGNYMDCYEEVHCECEHCNGEGYIEVGFRDEEELKDYLEDLYSKYEYSFSELLEIYHRWKRSDNGYILIECPECKGWGEFSEYFGLV